MVPRLEPISKRIKNRTLRTLCTVNYESDLQSSAQGGVGIKKRHLGSIFFFQQPTYYVIRHKSIYGNNDIIAINIFDMISLSSAVYSGFEFPLYHS